VRNSWREAITVKGFAQALGAATISTAPFINAAREMDPSVDELEAAISLLTFKGAASVAAVHFSCSAIGSRDGLERTRSIVLQRIMDSVEIGYHFGMSASQLGPEIGMLIGFAQSIGAGLLSIHHKLGVHEASDLLNGAIKSQELLSRFECEPYQVSATALQHLGLTTEFASAAVMPLGNPNCAIISSNENVARWSAASEWIAALIAGKERPRRNSSAMCFPELLSPTPAAEIPMHLQILASSVESVRENHSAWSWHTRP
jgi:hypothetical protein